MYKELNSSTVVRCGAEAIRPAAAAVDGGELEVHQRRAARFADEYNSHGVDPDELRRRAGEDARWRPVYLQGVIDYNRARAVYEYMAGAVPNRTLPEETVITTTLPEPRALPMVKSDLGRGTADVTYALTSRVGVGVSYWYEQYRVTDFTLDAEANQELVRGQALLLGYLYRPYTANTIWGRLIYRW